jgi:carbonic anhydrase
MEVHFVHQKANSGDLGVVGVFLTEGAANQSFKQIADAFPNAADTEAAAPANANPHNLLPKSMDYWKYEGSLTTPPCSEVVDWMLCMHPVMVAKADIAKFTAHYTR